MSTHHELEVEVNVPPTRFFKAFTDLVELGPKIIPGITGYWIKGDGGVGSVVRITLPAGNAPHPEGGTFTEEIDVLDKKNLIFSYRVIEAETSSGLTRIKVTVHVLPTGYGGQALVKVVLDLESDQIPYEEQRARFTTLIELVEAYLVANEDEYWA